MELFPAFSSNKVSRSFGIGPGVFLFLWILNLPAILAENLTSEVNIETSSSSSSAMKFIEFLGFHEKNQEAQFLLQIPPGRESMFLNARSLEVIQQSSAKDKVKVTFGCKMIYTLYPYDTHLCSIMAFGEAVISSSFCGDLKAYEFHVKGYLSLPLVPPGGAGKVSPKFEEMGSQVISGGGAGPAGQVTYLLMERTSAMQMFSQMYTPPLTLTLLSFLTMLDAISFPIRIATSLSMMLTSLVVTAILWSEIPRAGQGDVTILEHFFAICVGFIFQAFFTNILLHWYLSLAKKHMESPQPTSTQAPENQQVEEANGRNGATVITVNSFSNSRETLKMEEISKSPSPSINAGGRPEKVEEFIMKMGKFHRFMYMKCLKPAKKQLPIFFLIINVIYWALVIYFSSGIPKGFQYLPKTTDASAALCLLG